MFTRYSEHLQNVLNSIETNIDKYDREEEKLKRLVGFKPEKYQRDYDKLQKKKKEADIKLSYIVPRMEKLAGEIEKLK